MAHKCIHVYQGLFQGGGQGGAFAPPGNLVAPPRKHTMVPQYYYCRERERERERGVAT